MYALARVRTHMLEFVRTRVLARIRTRVLDFVHACLRVNVHACFSLYVRAYACTYMRENDEEALERVLAPTHPKGSLGSCVGLPSHAHARVICA